MATERNPYEQRPEGDNVIRMEMQQPSETEATFELDPETGEITVDLEGSAESIEVEVNMNSGFDENLVDILDKDICRAPAGALQISSNPKLHKNCFLPKNQSRHRFLVTQH